MIRTTSFVSLLKNEARNISMSQQKAQIRKIKLSKIIFYYFVPANGGDFYYPTSNGSTLPFLWLFHFSQTLCDLALQILSGF